MRSGIFDTSFDDNRYSDTFVEGWIRLQGTLRSKDVARLNSIRRKLARCHILSSVAEIFKMMTYLDVCNNFLKTARFVLHKKGVVYGRLEILDLMPNGFKDNELLLARSRLELDAPIKTTLIKMGRIGLRRILLPNGLELVL